MQDHACWNRSSRLEYTFFLERLKPILLHIVEDARKV